jgi:hypothetical protein
MPLDNIMIGKSALMNYFFLPWFKIYLVVIGLLITYGMVMYLMRNKIIKRIYSLTDEEKSKLVRSISKTIPIYKILFWMLPVFCILIPSIYSLNSQIFIFLTTTIVFMYIAALEGYLISKALLKAFRM